MNGLFRLAALSVIVATLAGCTQTPDRSKAAAHAPSTVLGRYLASRAPLFPAHRVIAFYGEAGVPAMGVLAQGTLPRVTQRLRTQAAAYGRFGRPVIPAFELIAIAAHAAPGVDDAYHGAVDETAIRKYLAGARTMSGLLVVDVQPGRSHFLPLVKKLASILREPDVGLALDPEWEMGRSQVPGETIGGTTAAEVNEVARYVSSIVRANHLPQKLFIVHQFTPEMIAGRSQIVSLAELATTFHVDGFGARPLKVHAYRTIATSDARFHNGLKLFYTQDTKMFSPADAMRQRPQPDLITYQ